MPAKKYVKLEYQPLNGRNQIAEQFSQASHSDEKFDFVETLMYSRDSAVLMKGRLTDDCVPDQVCSSSRALLELHLVGLR